MAQKKKKKKTVKPTPKFTEWWRSPSSRKLRGAIYILFSLFATIAMLSFLVNGGDLDDNWMGKLGYYVASFFCKNVFGLGSFGLMFLLMIYGLSLWEVKLLPWWKTFWCTIFWSVWLSMVLGYIGGKWVKTDVFENFSGVGYTIGGMLDSIMSWWTLVVLVFLACVFLVYVHKVKIDLPKIDLPELMAASREAVAERVEDVNTEEKKSKIHGEVVNLNFEDKPEEEEGVEPDPADGITLFSRDFGGKKKKKSTDIELQVNDNDVASPETETDPDTGFSIDDEFMRVVERAQSHKVELDVAPETPTEPQPAAGDVTFTINDAPQEEATSEAGTAAEQQENDEDYARHFGVDELYDPHLDLKTFQMPDTSILEDWEVKNTKVTKEELVANKDRIVHTLQDYGIEIVEISASPGPTVTLYEIKPAPGVRISKIKSLEDDIALSLSALGIRIIAPIPGKGAVGIEVPNTNPQIVSMKTMLESDAFRNCKKMELPIAFGKTISNEPFVTDLAKMPHLLMAGATGTGKSVGLNAVIASLLYKKHPSELKFVMVDPKKVELSIYNKIERHYLAKLPDSDEAIITDVKKVVRTLNSLCIEMDQRYDLLKAAGVRKITEYNDKFIHRHLNPDNGHHFMPYIVLIVDEFADLIMTAGKEVEGPICRLAQLARAVGIHLIIATQRPTTNIITGTIKANFPARVAFKVASNIDSRTILDAGGAQRLIGRGDMLISLSGSDLVRLQCALMETSECEKLSELIGSQRGYPDGFLLPEYLDENEEPNKEFDPKQKDEFFNDAARLVVASQFGSTSLLQRKLQLGYNRAGRIIDQLEAAGIVGPYNGSKPRDVLVHDEVELEERLREL